MRLLHGRKGVLYLFLAIIFVGLFLTVFLTYHEYLYQDRQEVVSMRVHTMADFITDLHEDILRAAYISGFRALIGTEDRLSETGAFFTDETAMAEALRSAFLNGTMNGTPIDVMENASFNDYLSRVRAHAYDRGINVTVDVTSIELTQATPWIVHVDFDADFTITDLGQAAWWSYRRHFTADIPIAGLKDPLYTVNTLGRVPVTVVPYAIPPEGFVDGTNTSTLKDFIATGGYRVSAEAPSFLQRFTGDLTPSPQGIESIVDLPALSDQGIVVHDDRSVVDHRYFAATPGNTSGDRCHLQGMLYTPDWFRIDADHVDDYDLANLTWNPCS